MGFFDPGGRKARRHGNAVTVSFPRKQETDYLPGNFLTSLFRHSGESRNPAKTISYKIPAFAGMTKKKVPDIPRKREEHSGEHFTSPRLRASAVKTVGGLA